MLKTTETLKKVGIVVLTYNSEGVIADCLVSLNNIDYRNKVVVVVDNASTDNTVNLVKNKFPNVHIIQNESNTGFAAGNNAGINSLLTQEAVDFVILLNDDIAVKNNLIAKLIEPFEKNSKVGVTGAIITYDQNKNKIWFAGGYLNKLLFYTKHSHMNEVLGTSPVATTCDFITGCCMCVSKEVINKVGLLAEKYFMYFEDVDYCIRVRNNGYSVTLVPENLVYHKVSTSAGIGGTNKLTALKAYYIARNAMYCIKEHTHGPLMLFNLFGQIFIRAPFYIYKGLVEKNYASIGSYLRGFRDGLSNL